MTSRQNEVAKPGLLVLASTYPRWQGDAEPGFVHELSRRLSSRFDVRVLTSSSPSARLRDAMDGVTVIRYRYAPRACETLVYGGGIPHQLRRSPWKVLLVPPFVLGQLIAGIREIRTRRIAAIHAHWLLPQGVVAALLTIMFRSCPPVLVTAHGSDVHASRSWVARRLRKFVFARASKATVVGQALRDQLAADGIDPALIDVRPMGVDVAEFRIDPTAMRTRDEILFVGRLVPAKGARHALAAMPAILARFPSARLAIAGAGPELESLRGAALQMGISNAVEFLGAVEHERLPAIYRRATVLVAPFDIGAEEGFGLVLAEAMACGCPVVAGDVPGIDAIVTSPVIGRVVPRGNVQALADALSAALAAPPSAEQELERANAAQRFSWQASAAAYLDALTAMARRA